MSESFTWLLHQRNSGDTSAYLTLFTPDKGLVKALCKGGRLPKKQALLQPFTPLWVLFDERFGHFYVKKIEMAATSLPLVSTSLFSALYLNELLYLSLQPLDTDDALYNAYVLALQSLAKANESSQIESTLRRFEWALLTALGLNFSLNQDAHTRLPILADKQYRFIPGDGLVETTLSRVDNSSSKSLRPAACPRDPGVLLNAQDNCTEIERFESHGQAAGRRDLNSQQTIGFCGAHILAFHENILDDSAVLKTIKRMMRQVIDGCLDGKKIQSRQLFVK